MFAPGSPRLVTSAEARRIRDSAGLQWVGVFADHAPEEVADLARTLGLLRGAAARRRNRGGRQPHRHAAAAGCEVWKAVRVQDRVPLREHTGADRVLLDGWVPGKLGGAGTRFDWSLLADYPERRAVVLAGGLDAGNVEQAARLETWGLDLSSGVESSPGHKDPGKLLAFFSARRRLPGRGDDTR
jgi:indole-3-glycerol phosphate synthase/phosphoribosylanthranilate isomerase